MQPAKAPAKAAATMRNSSPLRRSPSRLTASLHTVRRPAAALGILCDSSLDRGKPKATLLKPQSRQDFGGTKQTERNCTQVPEPKARLQRLRRVCLEERSARKVTMDHKLGEGSQKEAPQDAPPTQVTFSNETDNSRKKKTTSGRKAHAPAHVQSVNNNAHVVPWLLPNAAHLRPRACA